ncbi:MAG: hypothetical protein ACXADY_15320 [Candidatus Hodarchaeales archaeon]|jgi:uncharacterized membrane protein YvlD (DUF360 family)
MNSNPSLTLGVYSSVVVAIGIELVVMVVIGNSTVKITFSTALFFAALVTSIVRLCSPSVNPNIMELSGNRPTRHSMKIVLDIKKS